VGPKIFAPFSRRRLFGAALTISSIFLMLLALITNLVLAIFIVVLLGAFAGVSWVAGFTMLGSEVDDEVRGRTFAFVQSLIRISLVLVLAIAPVVAAWIGKHTFGYHQLVVTYNGAAFTMFAAGLLGTGVGIFSYRQMRDRPTVSLWSDIAAAFRGELGTFRGAEHRGIFIAFEGGEGSGKSTQVKLLKAHFESIGETVLLTHEPGETELGKKLREILLSPETGEISPRSEALLYAADRANHVAKLIKPALDKGEVVITDRYMDSSIAYQGAGRVLMPAEIARISRWATETLYPDLTIVLDIPANVGLSRFVERDRLEAEPLAFHDRVRQEFLNLAKSDPERYLIVDAQQSIEEISNEIKERVNNLPRLKINQKRN
jgi:dTMP kinase